VPLERRIFNRTVELPDFFAELPEDSQDSIAIAVLEIEPVMQAAQLLKEAIEQYKKSPSQTTERNLKAVTLKAKKEIEELRRKARDRFGDSELRSDWWNPPNA